MASRRKSFDKYEIRYLHALGKNAEPAVQELTRFLTLLVPDPGDMIIKKAFHQNGTHIVAPPMSLALEVLARFPDKVQPLRKMVEEVLRAFPAKPVGESQEAYRKSLQKFLNETELSESTTPQ
jgi:hypothetical protein